MKRVLNVTRLQLINRQTYVWLPLIILSGAFLLSLLIYAMIPLDQPKYGGGSQAPLWYFLFVGIAAMTYSFPFSQALSITRRDFYFGTLITAVGASVLMATIFVVGGLVEVATGGWGLNGYFFHLPWVWESGPLGAGVVYFAMTMFAFIIGFTFATIFKTWGLVVLTISWVGLALALVGVVFVITRLELWESVWLSILDLGALGLAGCGIVVTAVLALVALFAFRRAKP